MKSIIMIPFAYNENKQSGVNLSGTADKRHIYFKNICVALVSAKASNPESDVALVSNIDFPREYTDILSSKGILQIKVPFDLFVFPDGYKWGLAFYKLCALHHVVRELEYDNYCYLDSDVYVQNSLSCVWEECTQNILLYDINHGLQVADYRRFLSELQAFQVTDYVTHYGGEFFAANRENALLFSEKCLEIYDRMLRQNFTSTMGDEFISSLAAHKLPNVRNAGAYIYRFWTGTFRLISTNYRFNEVSVLHVPAEKEDGMITLFDKYIRKGRPVSSKTAHRLLHLTAPAVKTRIKTFLLRVKSFVKPE